MKKTLIVCLLALAAQSGLAAVSKQRNKELNCNLYKIVKADTNGKFNLSSGEVIINQKDAYGLSITDMEINFNNREVLVQPQINFALGFNRALTNSKSTIASDNPDFTFLINQLNRKLLLFEQMCISDSNEIIYAKMFEAATEQK